MGNIDWLPIADLPERLKDGRKVLLWDWSGAQTAEWNGRGWHTGFASELDGDPIMVDDPIHFAEISEPMGLRESA